MSEENTAIARKAYQAYVDKDRATIEALIADDFRFWSPRDNGIDRRTYFERCWAAAESIKGFKFVNLVAHDDQVFVTYEGQIRPGRAFRNTEIMTIRNGRISAVEVYFGWSLPHDAPAGGFVGP